MVHGQFSSFIALPVILCTRDEFAIHWGFSGFNMFSEAIRTYVIWNSNKALPWFLDYKFGRSISWSSLSNMWGSAFYSCAKKTLAWPHHFIKSECLGPYNKFNPAPFYCSSYFDGTVREFVYVLMLTFLPLFPRFCHWILQLFWQRGIYCLSDS